MTSMVRRHFLAAAAAAASARRRVGAQRGRLLLPTDTPDELGFRIMWYNPVPPIDKQAYHLQVTGLVEQPRQYSAEALGEFPRFEQSTRLKCVQCWSARATWGGFRFEEILEQVKPQSKATAVRIDCADKWYEYMSLDEMAEPGVMLCTEMAGKPLTDQHGAPLRLLAPSKYGYKSAKLITKITFVEEGGGSMACDIGPYYSSTGEILAGYDHPLDLGPRERRKIPGGEIVDY